MINKRLVASLMLSLRHGFSRNSVFFIFHYIHLPLPRSNGNAGYQSSEGINLSIISA